MKKFLESSWTIGIATTLLGFILTVSYDLIKEKQVFTTIGKFFSILWGWIITFLTFDLKVWWVLLGIAVIFFALYTIVKIIEKKELLKPEFTDYTQDKFRIWKWSWEWKFNKMKNVWQIVNLQAHCPKCDTPMINKGFGIFQCPRCAYNPESYDHEEPYEVEKVISDNLYRQKNKGEIQS